MRGAVALASWLVLASPGLAFAQDTPEPPRRAANPESEPNHSDGGDLAGASPESAGAGVESEGADSLAAIRRELESQREELRAQQEELDAQRALLDAETRALEREPAASPPDGDGDFSDADIDAIVAEESAGSGAGGTGALPADEPVRLYGFIDMGWRYLFAPDERAFINSFLETDSNTFVFGNVNLFVDVQPDPEWRGLFEIRYTNVPHGSERGFASPALGLEYEREDRFEIDTTGTSGRNSILLGSLVIERAWLEWTFRDFFRVRVGYFLTPYGIWNVDQRTPVLIALYLPNSLVRQTFPQRQLGVQVYGRVAFESSMEFGYHAWVSNGRTPGQFDLTHDKAFGGRVYFDYRSGDVHLRLGASGWLGTFADFIKEIVSVAPFATRRIQTVDGLEYGLALDASLDIGDLRIRAEGIMSRNEYYNGLRPTVPFGAPGSTLADQYGWNAYLIAAYRFDPGIEPYVYFEFANTLNPLGDVTLVPSVGLNLLFSPSVALKTQFNLILQEDISGAAGGIDLSEQTILSIQTRLILAF